VIFVTIIYPEDLEFHSEYLVKDFGDTKLYTSWMLGKEVKPSRKMKVWKF
jgi:hypothetical protein